MEYRLVGWNDGKKDWWKAEKKHWFWGWEFVDNSVEYSKDECLEDIRKDAKAYAVKPDFKFYCNVEIIR